MARFNYDRFLVWDLEGTCWKDLSRDEQAKKTETIEIGITEINLSSLEITKTKSYLVKPKNLDISEFCTELTGITKESLESAKHLMQVSKEIRKDFNPSKVYSGAWGSDPDLLKPECEKKGAIYPFSERFINLQDLFSLQFGLDQTVSMFNALKNLDIELEGKHHSGQWDSYNTAKVLIKVWKENPIRLTFKK